MKLFKRHTNYVVKSISSGPLTNKEYLIFDFSKLETDSYCFAKFISVTDLNRNFQLAIVDTSSLLGEDKEL